ncbi:MAG TPA: DNA gyrase subunit A [Candidatus Borkfalkia faecigallinarum]|uniref:DNA gyrase subunit A n=1 Tax=Candidatus Borkfalkia faecigallinarum TaxID=2838509 RepID=A0A9D1VUA0_9FIRM|nr:DNA gyrase subunit A [Candidatus Borkfalkia faecigallinarum]
MTNLIDVEVDEELKKSFIAYAMAVNVSRAIPDVRDGLKPVHRRILYSMHEMGLYNDKAYRKCARIVGDVLGKYHPHGDFAVYDALVRLAQDFTINCPLVDGHGNFGSVDGDPPAAMRYTEARMSKLAAEMLRDLDKETVDFYPTFDDTGMQPTVLPARFPNLLVNGSDGIAVGMATNIPPHNLAEVIDGVIAQIDDPDITVDALMQHIPAPDFPTGAILMGRAGIKRAYMTGRGNYVLRSRCEIEEYQSGSATRTRIVVTEIPYQVNKEKLIKTIADLVKDKRVEGISDIREESDRDGMRIVIELRKDANAQVVLNTLYKHTQLQTSNGIILLALVDGEPKVLSLKEIIHHYIEHQKEVIVRRTRFDLSKAEERAHIVAGLVLALANIDEVIAIIKASADKNVACAKLMEAFELSDKQANAILEMRLQRLTSLEVEKLQEELAELERTIADLKDILANEWRVLEIIKADLTEIRAKYAQPRKTELSLDYGEIDIADLIEEEDVVVSMTHSGYVKRQPVAEYRTQRRGGMGVTAHKPKDEDFVENLFICSTHDSILFFSNFGKVYSIKAYEIPEAQRQARGRAIVNLLQIGQDEKITAMIPLTGAADGFIAMATRRGLIKKTALEEFANIRKVGKIAIKINEGDELISVQFTTGKDELIIASREGKCIRFSEEDVRPMGRDTQGVRAMALGEEDCLVDMLVVKPGCKILTVTSNGFGKRSDADDYRLQGRAGKGIKAGVFTEKTGYLVNLKVVADGDDVMIISDSGTIIRLHAADISLIGRNTQGVRIMRLKDAKVATVAVAPSEDEEGKEDAAEEVPAPGDPAGPAEAGEEPGDPQE